MKNDIKIRKQIQRKIWVQLNLGWIITLSIILGLLTVLGLLAWLIISFNKNQNPKYANINIIYYISSSLISWLNKGTISGCKVEKSCDHYFYLKSLKYNSASIFI
ncbi:hypothetical protein, partial [Mycoplasmopsis anatis]|uniref:hypothetical protein n=1 Tax=Mycoplasmopsis anatis TaxID=171279 RepID=UPI001C4EB185